MHLNAQRPVFVPREHVAEIEKLSKAALMDLVWDYAQMCSAGDVMDTDATMGHFRKQRDIILTHRKQAKSAA